MDDYNFSWNPWNAKQVLPSNCEGALDEIAKAVKALELSSKWETKKKLNAYKIAIYKIESILHGAGKL